MIMMNSLMELGQATIMLCKCESESSISFSVNFVQNMLVASGSTALRNSLKEVEELLVYFQVNVFSATIISSCTLSIYIFRKLLCI